MREIKIEELKEAKLHFGHRTFKWNPKFAPFIYKKMYGMHFIDLEQAKVKIEEGMKIAKKLGQDGKRILWVGTKKQAAPIIKEWAEKTDCKYVNLRWFAGTLTNFQTISERLKQIDYLEDVISKNGQLSDRVYNKKEMVKISRDYNKLNKNLAGLRGMKDLPQLVFVVDVGKEMLAIKEAKKLGIKVMAIVDSNINPQIVDYIIPGSDDAMRAIEYVISSVGSAFNEGRALFEKKSLDDEDAIGVANEALDEEENVPNDNVANTEESGPKVEKEE
ncbi:30S ribosomal protein S2 [bacterium]|nr:30S ribosomal protein S2 [bacterium]